MSAQADGIKVFVRQAIFRQGKDNRIMISSDVLATAAFGYAQDGRGQKAEFSGHSGGERNVISQGSRGSRRLK
jgi:hypothetical protein